MFGLGLHRVQGTYVDCMSFLLNVVPFSISRLMKVDNIFFGYCVVFVETLA